MCKFSGPNRLQMELRGGGIFNFNFEMKENSHLNFADLNSKCRVIFLQCKCAENSVRGIRDKSL